MKRAAVLAYGVLVYAMFLGVFLYAVGFIGNFLVPKSIDSAPQVPFLQALLTNVALLGVFGLQHSVMARPAFKRWLTSWLSPAIERSTYVLATNLALILLFWGWQPMGGMVWNVEEPIGQAVLYGLCAFGWLLVLVTTFLINHFDLFGLRQVWLYALGKPYTPLRFVTPGPYKLVRHPLYVGWFLAIWCTPQMTVTHMLFALVTAAYIVAAISLEERDLIDAHPEYQAYRRQVPKLLPRFRPVRGQQQANDADVV